MSSAWKLHVRQACAGCGSLSTASSNSSTFKVSFGGAFRVRLILGFPSGWLGFWSKAQFSHETQGHLRDWTVLFFVACGGNLDDTLRADHGCGRKLRQVYRFQRTIYTEDD